MRWRMKKLEYTMERKVIRQDFHKHDRKTLQKEKNTRNSVTYNKTMLNAPKEENAIADWKEMVITVSGKE